MKKSLSSLAVLAIASAGMGGAIVAPAQPVPVAQVSQQAPAKQVPAQQDIQRITKRVARMAGGYLMTRGDTRRSGPGWSNKHVQRMATKARNVKRHRAANR